MGGMEMRWTTIKLWVFWICMGMMYYGVILLISLIFTASSDDDDDVCHNFEFKMLFIIASGEFFGDLFAMLCIDKFGRIPLQVCAYSLTGVAMFALGLGYENQWSSMAVLLPI